MGRRAFVRDRILEAAFDVVATEGFEAATTRAIAAKAGVGAASMFKHFPTREDLGRELYRVALAPLQADLAALAAQSPTPKVALRRFVALACLWYDTRPRALALLIFPPHEFQPWELDQANPEAVRSVLARLLGTDADTTAVIWGACTGPLIDRYLRHRAGTMTPHADTLAARIVRLLT